MMGKGEWSIDGKELDQGTIENRLMVAISVAEWAHVHGYRGPTDFIRERTASGGWRYALLRTASRFKSYPILSSNFAITFLRSTASDQSYFLCALTITLTGIRISELRSLDSSTSRSKNSRTLPGRAEFSRSLERAAFLAR